MSPGKVVAWDLPTLLHDVPGVKRYHYPLRRYTSFHIGGVADAWVRIEELAALRQVQDVARCHQIPLFILGGGSNLLIRDGGVRGIVVALRGVFRTYRITPHAVSQAGAEAFVYAGVGYPLSRLAMQLARQGWRGMEFAYGIPGTLGGAMVMNAGTHLGDLRQVMVAARMLLANGQDCELPVAAVGLQYRTSSYPAGAILLGGTMRVRAGEPQAITAVMHESYKRRQQTQPLCLPNAGSIFKNPPGEAAAQLIDALDLKGTRIGDAMLSLVHANFIVNMGQATAKDVEALIDLVQSRVQDAYGIDLELEVRVLGEEA
ncbi:MAG: UDP-N-acetylmuramate dehydrogenase [bacterium]|nr:UDP-N-acetylmuramate dehydrogenase [bacterium]